MALATFILTNRGPIKDVLGKAVAQVALEIERDAKIDCPVDTGTLSRSIASSQIPAPDPTWQVGTNITYAPWVEFGTSRMTAKPFLGPAVEKARAKYS